jgi:FkbM family methyltransferase
VSAIRNIANLLLNHPLTQGNRLAAVLRFVRWQCAARICRFAMVVPYVDDTVLVIRKGMTGATGAIYVGLMEPEDMSFALHLLREDDLFGDIGANVGVYTVLASGVRKARSVAVEPVPQTAQHLHRNLAINSLETLAELRQVGVGGVAGELRFTVGKDAMNHVAVDDSQAVSVPVIPLDDLFETQKPILLKIDVEGFETEVLLGGKQTLSDPSLKAIIIELNGCGARYGYDDASVDASLRAFGFEHVSYDFRTRALRSTPFASGGNSLYVRDRGFVEERLKTAPPFRVLSQTI